MKRMMRFSAVTLAVLLVMTFMLLAAGARDFVGVLSTLAAPALHPLAPQGAGAEYAIRWNVNEGGPQTASATLAALGQAQTDSDDYEVQYFEFTPPADTPTGVTAILRQRNKVGKQKSELTFKYRSDSVMGRLGCPISAAPDENKDEVDITILGLNESRRAYSHSCTVAGANPPPALAARAKGCTSMMTRLKSGTLKVEEWHLPGGETLVEVSRNGSTSEADLASFQQNVVKRLLDAGVRPSRASKTELGSSCQ